MALFLLLAGLVLLVTGVNGTTQAAGALIKRDFTGKGNFFGWLVAILLIGALGYFPKVRPISYGFMALLFIVILLTSGSGFFDRLKATADEFSDKGLESNQGGNDFGSDLFDIDFRTLVPELRNIAADYSANV